MSTLSSIKHTHISSFPVFQLNYKKINRQKGDRMHHKTQIAQLHITSFKCAETILKHKQQSSTLNLSNLLKHFITQITQLHITSSKFFFLEYARELCIIVLRRKEFYNRAKHEAHARRYRPSTRERKIQSPKRPTHSRTTPILDNPNNVLQ